jgi:hypothetical protein
MAWLPLKENKTNLENVDNLISKSQFEANSAASTRAACVQKYEYPLRSVYLSNTSCTHHFLSDVLKQTCFEHFHVDKRRQVLGDSLFAIVGKSSDQNLTKYLK